MYQDEIIRDVWKVRETYVEQTGKDLTSMITDLKSRQEKRKVKLVDRRQKRSPRSS